MLKTARFIAAGALLLVQLALTSPAALADVPGTWSIRTSTNGAGANLTLVVDEPKGSSDTSSFPVDPESLGLRDALAAERERHVEFVLRREAGSFACSGLAGRSHGAGTFLFTPNDAFVAGMRERGFTNLSASDIVLAAVVNLVLHFVDDVFGAGYHHLSYRMLIVLRSLGIDGPYMRAMQAAFAAPEPIDPEQLIPLRSLGVSPQYLSELRDAGLPLSGPDDAIRARALHVDAPYVLGLGHAGYAHLGFEDVLRLRSVGIDAGFIERVEAHGFAHPTLEQLIRLKTMKIVSAASEGATP